MKMQKCNNINEIINKIRKMDYDKEICIAELTWVKLNK